jgi:2-polyprenyl-3-methyl-5-hydroxy-6-metoxy-1,4-benzoquinol methylase
VNPTLPAEPAPRRAPCHGVRYAPVPLRAFFKALHAIGLNRLSWELQHRARIWETTDRIPRRTMIDHVAKLARGGVVIEHGCGDGFLASTMPPGSFSYWAGYDVSAAAVRHAKARGTPHTFFAACAMQDWSAAASSADLIIAEECVYYLSATEIPQFIGRCMAALKPAGVLLITVHDKRKHAATIRACSQHATLVDIRDLGERGHYVYRAHGVAIEPALSTPTSTVPN